MPQESNETGSEVTRLLRRWSSGDASALRELIPLIYKDLRRLAQHCLIHEKPMTLQATALVHEVYCKLVQQDRMVWINSQQFFYTAAGLMRRLIVDEARERRAEKRGGAWERVGVEELQETPGRGNLLSDVDTLQLNEALDRLEREDPDKARIVELRFFTGFDVTETARVLGISETTVKRQWRVARLWLHREMNGMSQPGDQP